MSCKNCSIYAYTSNNKKIKKNFNVYERCETTKITYIIPTKKCISQLYSFVSICMCVKDICLKFSICNKFAIKNH